jgi:hypothetical protein
LLFTVLLGGCAEIPFRSTDRYPLGNLAPEKVVADFRTRTPEEISMLNSIVFEFAGQQFLGVGFIEVQPVVKSFRVICLNPMGVKLFDLAGDQGGVKVNFALEPLASYGNIASAVAIDINRIYFDAVPSDDAMHYRLNDRLVFGKGQPSGYLEHVFAGRHGDLVEKRFYADQIISWSVGYYEYVENNGKRYPKGIVLTDYKGGYRLIIREKEQTVEKDQE